MDLVRAEISKTNPAPSSASRNIPVRATIDRVILEGFPSIDRKVFGDALHRELANLIRSGRHGSGFEARSPQEREATSAKLTLPSEPKPRDLARRVARVVYQQLFTPHTPAEHRRLQ